MELIYNEFIPDVFVIPLDFQGQNYLFSLRFNEISDFPSSSLYYGGWAHRSFFNDGSVHQAVLSHPEWFGLMTAEGRQIPLLEQVVRPLTSLSEACLQVDGTSVPQMPSIGPTQEFLQLSIPGGFDADSSEKNLGEEPVRIKRCRSVEKFNEEVVGHSVPVKVGRFSEINPEIRGAMATLRPTPRSVRIEPPEEQVFVVRTIFIKALFNELNDRSQNSIVKWSGDRKSLLVDRVAFEAAEGNLLAPKWGTLLRQFNYYGFYKELEGGLAKRIYQYSHPVLKKEIPQDVSREEYIKDKLYECYYFRRLSSRRY